MAINTKLSTILISTLVFLFIGCKSDTHKPNSPMQVKDSVQQVKTHVSPMVRCQKGGGQWQSFADNCVNFCSEMRSSRATCENVETMGCQCKPNHCWNGTSCEPI